MVKAAKRRKKEEEPEFALPEFDEVAYMRREMEGARTAIVVVLLAVLVAALLFTITLSTGAAIVAFFPGLALTFATRRRGPSSCPTS